MEKRIFTPKYNLAHRLAPLFDIGFAMFALFMAFFTNQDRDFSLVWVLTAVLSLIIGYVNSKGRLLKSIELGEGIVVRFYLHRPIRLPAGGTAVVGPNEIYYKGRGLTTIGMRNDMELRELLKDAASAGLVKTATVDMTKQKLSAGNRRKALFALLALILMLLLVVALFVFSYLIPVHLLGRFSDAAALAVILYPFANIIGKYRLRLVQYGAEDANG